VAGTQFERGARIGFVLGSTLVAASTDRTEHGFSVRG
jgi:hypothetical protein